MDDVVRLDLNASSQSLSRCSRFRASIRTCAPKGIQRVSQTLSDLDSLMDLSDMEGDLADDDLSLTIKMELESDLDVQSNTDDGHNF